ncbi:uncharacterized protein LOC144427390 [Styela clava]
MIGSNMETEDEISQKEKDLTEQLKAVCTPFGDERRSKLKESTDILFEMGKLYLEKAKSSTGMKQKLDFIKCSALLHGAKVRYGRILYDIKGRNKVHKFLLSMEKVLLQACGGKQCDKTLSELSSHISKTLKNLRKDEKDQLQKMEPFDEKLSKLEIMEKQLNKIETIQLMMEKNTQNYITLMTYIAEYCMKLLGDSPCSFALVGLGSLAREEITLYSDFEHVIILKDDIDDSPNYHEVKEYFRWFAVIFEIIMIGLGETIIRSVGVKSINDLYSEDKSKNWYYDNFTTSGVSFDGMVPHACSTPLGRQEPTKNRKHKVELIQPVSKMASYLTSDEDIKNGYYLKEMLIRTCFVWGNKELYDEFQRCKLAILEKESKYDVFKNIEKQIMENVNFTVTGRTVTNLACKTDVKNLFYRPITALISYWARFLEDTDGTDNNYLTTSSSFDLCDYLGNPIKYALAVAHELRLKIYAKSGCRRFKVYKEEIFEYVSKNCAIHCLRQTIVLVSNLLEEIRQVMPRDELSSSMFGKSQKTFTDGKTLAQMQLELYEDAIPRLEEEARLEKDLLNEKPFTDDKTAVFDMRVIEATMFAARQTHTRPSTEWMEHTEIYLKGIINDSSEHPAKILFAMDMLNILYVFQHKHRESIELNNQRFGRLLGHAGTQILMRIRFTQVMSMRISMNPVEMLEFCTEGMEKNNDICSLYGFELGIAFAEMKMGNKLKGATKLISSVKDLFECKCRMFGKLLTLEIMAYIFKYQMLYNLVEDAYQSLEIANIIEESQIEIVNLEAVIEDILSSGLVGMCYVEIGIEEQDISKKKELFLKGISFCKLPQTDRKLNKISKQYYEIGIIRYIFACLVRTDLQDIPNICSLYSDAPASLTNDSYIRSYLLMVTANFPDIFLAEENLMIVLYSMSITIDNSQSLLSHPFVISAMKNVFAQVLKMALSKSVFLDPALTGIVYQGKQLNSDYLASLNNIFSHYEASHFSASVATVWKRLIKGCFSAKDLHQIIFFVGLKLFISLGQRSCDFVTKTMKEYSLIGDNMISNLYNKGVQQYIDNDFQSAAHYFWKLVNNTKHRSTTQIRSIVMLYYSIIKNPFGFNPCVIEGYIGLTQYSCHEGRQKLGDAFPMKP